MPQPGLAGTSSGSKYTLQSLLFPGVQPWGTASLLSSMIPEGQGTKPLCGFLGLELEHTTALRARPWVLGKKTGELPGYDSVGF